MDTRQSLHTAMLVSAAQYSHSISTKGNSNRFVCNIVTLPNFPLHSMSFEHFSLSFCFLFSRDIRFNLSLLDYLQMSGFLVYLHKLSGFVVLQ